MHGTYIGPTPVTYYGCVQCQRNHRLGLDPEYHDHLFRQSKHGVRTRGPLTVEETFVAACLAEQREAEQAGEPACPMFPTR